MDDELDEITRKLADDAGELDLDSEADLGLDDDVIDLLDDAPSLPPSGRGLDYDEPDLGATASFAETLQAQQQTAAPSADPITDTQQQGPDSALDDDDPLLLLDEELVMDKDANDGGILTIAALVLALLGISVAGFATFQNRETGAQIEALGSQLENPPPDPRLTELEAVVVQNDKKLTQIQAQQDTDASHLKDLDTRLEQLLEETRKDDTAAQLKTIGQELKGLGSKLGRLEQRMESNQGRFEQQQEALRSEFSDRLNKLSTDPPPSQATASTDPSAVRILGPQTGAPPGPTGSVPSSAPPPGEQPQAARPGTAAAEPAPPSDVGGQGLWVANLASFNSDRDASRILKQLQGHGIFPKKRQVQVKGKTWYRLYVEGFANATAAKRYVNKVKDKPGLSRAWVGRAP
ncbi:SPOR domain-containing protein [Magnetovirga frankeli]|uniref:SPOR domain-containing protein n=1 Tax=Magnetovirga frankeli TaxID=947516 RepID=UPI0012931984|nr:SPOR domain-containing protein [gamma proteobacterium SS-5]